MTNEYINQLEIIPWGSSAHCAIAAIAMESSTQGMCAPLTEDPMVREEEHLTEHSRVRVCEFASAVRKVEITSTIETADGVKAVLLRFSLTRGLALELSRMLSGANDES